MTATSFLVAVYLERGIARRRDGFEGTLKNEKMRLQHILSNKLMDDSNTCEESRNSDL